MCIFIRPVQRVAKTRIFIAPIGATSQVLVYENEVHSASENAMILPIPATPEGEVKWINMQTIPSIFDACDELFPQGSPDYGGSFAFGGVTASWGPKRQLEVEKVGGYACSHVPALPDFERLSATFKIPVNIRKVLVASYGEPGAWSFIVCQFDRTKSAMHPIAFQCNRMRDGKCFIPTRHAHGVADAVDVNAPVVHEGITCDGCGEFPIRHQARWKCHHCSDYDLCNKCYVGKRSTVHSEDHLFLHIPRNTPSHKLHPIPSFGTTFGREETAGDDAEDGFDHTIYIANGVITASPMHYTSLETASRYPAVALKRLTVDVIPLMLPQWRPMLQAIHKVEIHGKAYPNQDYYVLPYQ